MNYQATLSNGQKILVSSGYTALKAVYFEVLIPVGLADENKTNKGVSHIIEHMITKKVTELLQPKIWVSNYVLDSFEATTHADFTRYAFSVNKSDLAIAKHIIQVIFQFPVISEIDLQQEIKVVIEELTSIADQPHFEVAKLAKQTLYGKETALGSDPTIIDEHISLDTIEEFWERNYCSLSSVFTVAGNITNQDLEKTFGTLTVNHTSKNLQDINVLVAAEQNNIPVQANQAVFTSLMGIEWRSEKELIRLELITDVLDKYLYKIFRDETLYDVSVELLIHKKIAIISILGYCDPAKLELAVQKLNELLDSFQGSISEDEVTQFLENYRKQLELEIYYPTSQIANLGWYYLYTSVLLGLEGVKNITKKTTPTDLLKLASKISGVPRIQTTSG